MASIQALTRRHLTTLLLLLLAGGFAVILGELILYKHYDGIQLIGLISTIAGLVIVLWGLFAKGGTRITLAVLMLLLSFAGVMGVIQHNEGEEGAEGARMPPLAAAATDGDVANRQIALPADDDGGPEQRGAGGESAPPPLAPLGLSGLALMGAVILFAKRDPDQVEPKA